MTKYRIEYSYNGSGVAFVKAKDEEEAREKYYEGEFYDDIDTSQDYEIVNVSVAPKLK